MRILIEAHHPAHIHFFKHAVHAWQERGDEVLLLGRDRDVMKRLLEAYTWIPSRSISSVGSDNRFPFLEMLRRQASVATELVRFRPDVVVSVMGSYTQSAKLFGVPNIIFTDSEFQEFNHRIAHPFATKVYTPDCFWKNLGAKQVRYPGYHELAFLHPDRFRPDPTVLSMMHDAEPLEYVVCRISAWNTLHDIGAAGFGPLFDQFMTELAVRTRVFVVPEDGRLPAKWKHLRLNVPPERFHDVLAFAKLVVSEGASTASEAACLGTPAVYLNPTDRGYLRDQQKRYGLVHRFTDAAIALQETLRLLEVSPNPGWLHDAHKRLVAEHADVTEVVVQAVDEVSGRTSQGNGRAV